MISIEAHRASIGRFYYKAKCLSNIGEFNTNASCFFSGYLNYLVLHFNKNFGLFLLEFYDSTFIKRFKLLIDGDVESNPGPAQNQSSGRPKKGRGFRGTPNKQENCDNRPDIHFNISSNIRDLNKPLGLLNLGENVCFFNSVIQVLYSITAFRDYILSLLLFTDNPPVVSIKNLFREIGSSNNPVRTSEYLKHLELLDYKSGTQYDAHECLLQLLDRIYPIISDDCIFKLVKHEWTFCNACQIDTHVNVASFDFSVPINDTTYPLTINNIVHELMNPHGVPLKDYRCDRPTCQLVNSSTQAVSVTHISDMFIIQLGIFQFVDGISKKIIPRLNIDEEIHIWDTMTLHAIIYHQGEQANSGHYTSAVKINDSWFMISDSIVSNQDVKLSCSAEDTSVPYVLIYKKKTDAIDCVQSSVSDTPANYDPSTITDIHTSTSEMMNRHSLLKELNIQEERITNADKRKKKDEQSTSKKAKKVQKEGLNNAKSPVKRKLKYNATSKKKVESFRAKVNDAEKDDIRDKDKKRKQIVREKLNDAEKVEIRDKDKKKEGDCT